MDSSWQLHKCCIIPVDDDSGSAIVDKVRLSSLQVPITYVGWVSGILAMPTNMEMPEWTVLSSCQ